MPPKPRVQLPRIMARADGVCGAQIEGRDRLLSSARHTEVGHKVHRSFFKFFGRARNADFKRRLELPTRVPPPRGHVYRD